MASMSTSSIAAESPAIEWSGPTRIAISGSASGFFAPASECVPSAPTRVAVVRCPTTECGRPSASCTAGALKPIFQPTRSAPLCRVARQWASWRRVASTSSGAHGSITIFSASRRS